MRVSFGSIVCLHRLVQRLPFLVLDVSVGLQILVDALLDHAHVDEHIGVSDALCSKQHLLLAQVALNHLRYLSNTLLDFLCLNLVCLLISLHLLHFIVRLLKLLFKLLNCSSFLAVLTTLRQVAINFALHLKYLCFVVLNFMIKLINKFEHSKVLLFVLDKSFYKSLHVSNSCGSHHFCECLLI